MYSVDNKRKLIIITAGSLTDEERREVDDYIKYSGYESKVVKARTNTTASIGDDDIKKILKDDKNALSEYEKAKKKPSKKDPTKTVGFLGGKSWFIANREDDYIAFLKKTKQTTALESFLKKKKKK